MPKRPKKTVLNGECREFVVRLRDYFERECQNGGPLVPITQVVNRVADALGIGRATVSRITQEKYGDSSSTQAAEEDGERRLSTPNKIRRRVSKITEIDEFDAAAIREHVYAYYRRGEYPSLRKLLVSLKDLHLFNGSMQSLATVLHKIGVTYKQRVKRKIIIERTGTGIALARVDFKLGKSHISD